MFGPCFVVHYRVSFQFVQPLAGKGSAGCFTLIAI